MTLLLGWFLLGAGVWALGWPHSFADVVEFPHHEHFLHDVGAFQIGLAAALLLALIWPDALAVALAAFLVANTLHAYSHAIDLDQGGRALDPWSLGTLSILAAVAFMLRWRQLGGVLGQVDTVATTPALAPFTRQKTVSVTTYRRDGSPVATPVSIAVDGDRAYFRSFEKAGKTRRLRRDPTVEVGPSTARGTGTGPAIRGTARRIDGPEAARAARLLARKYPGLHWLIVPLGHRLARAKTGKTVHFELTPID